MFRRPFTTKASGLSHSALKYAVATGQLQRIYRSVYVRGSDPVLPIERSVGCVIAVDGVASGTLAGVLLGLDSVILEGKIATIPPRRNTRLPGVRRADIPPERIVNIIGVPCTNGLQTMSDLAAELDDITWEQVLESALRKRLVTIDELESVSNARGTKRIRRVLALRPLHAPPTESLLETLMVQLIRSEPRLPTPQRQVVVINTWEQFVARVDLAWPEHGVFLELDGHHHAGQPIYDANRQTAVVAAKAWLPGRFTWHEVTRAPKPTLRRLLELFEHASQLRRTT